MAGSEPAPIPVPFEFARILAETGDQVGYIAGTKEKKYFVNDDSILCCYQESRDSTPIPWNWYKLSGLPSWLSYPLSSMQALEVNYTEDGPNLVISNGQTSVKYGREDYLTTDPDIEIVTF